ncbi:MAG: HAD family hydrolase [Mycobacteriales bacterium]
MPPPLYTQTVIAFIWDFDKTLTWDYMQQPLFDAYGIDSQTFWREVNGLVEHYRDRGLIVSKDTAYLGHILSYTADGQPFAGLTNERLRELGARITLAPGMPDFMERTRQFVKDDATYAKHDITVEHYIVSTGLRQMIAGTALAKVVDAYWASELLPDPPMAGYLEGQERLDVNGVLTQVGYTIDNTSKTRVLFEINKGVNHDPQVDVNSQMAEEQRRIPFKNMIYIADGPSDVPVFSVVNKFGGKTLGVWTDNNFDGVMTLQEQGRIGGAFEADYSEGQPADRWLMRALKQLADEIVEARARAFSQIPGAPGHVV